MRDVLLVGVSEDLLAALGAPEDQSALSTEFLDVPDVVGALAHLAVREFALVVVDGSAPFQSPGGDESGVQLAGLLSRRYLHTPIVVLCDNVKSAECSAQSGSGQLHQLSRLAPVEDKKASVLRLLKEAGPTLYSGEIVLVGSDGSVIKNLGSKDPEKRADLVQFLRFKGKNIASLLGLEEPGELFAFDVWGSFYSELSGETHSFGLIQPGFFEPAEQS